MIVIDSDERRGYEQAKREQAMERARQRLEKLKERVAAGDLKRPEKIGAAVERIMKNITAIDISTGKSMVGCRSSARAKRSSARKEDRGKRRDHDHEKD